MLSATLRKGGELWLRSSSLRTTSHASCSYSTGSSATPIKLTNQRTKGFLILEDGSVFPGYSFGAEAPRNGEVVFTTGMVGYPENLTDPSYEGQIMTLTYPLMGNYGVPNREIDEFGLLRHFESDTIHVNGLIVQEYSEHYQHWQAERSLSQWLSDEGIPALTGVDTRALAQKLRSFGVLGGKIIFDDDIPFDNTMAKNLVASVSPKGIRKFGEGALKLIAVDCGMKNNIVRQLVSLGDVEVKTVPWDYDFTKEDYDGLFLSNGPGDPSMCGATIDYIRKAYEIGKPIFGICLGNQLMAHAAGGHTYKLKYGNRGQNQPCVDLLTNKVYITPQNHGFAVDNQSLPAGWKPYFINVNDGSNEGIYHNNKPFFSVQFHPEAKSGPYDTAFLFDRFKKLMVEEKRGYGKHYFSETQAEVKKVLVLGSGALQIGQAGEFDYSGSQCVKALKEEGVETVLINPNIATVMTAKDLADNVYFLPVTSQFVEEVIKKEKPDAILLGFGGQTALNCGVELAEKGILSKYNVKVLGTQVDTIMKTEDRELFNQAMGEIGLPVAMAEAVNTVDDALAAADKIGYPVICRAAYALGGLGSGFADNAEELRPLVRTALSQSPQVLIEKSFRGWKEVEYEVVRDQNDNCITVCNMENFDPMGIHTGESIVVAPSQTLSNNEYHMLRTSAVNAIRHLGIVGECNIQYSLDPKSMNYFVIEVNPRLSRSSALASKATGYPLAFVAAKLALGIKLTEIQNSVTKSTSACFEPSLDYIVTKIPRWDVSKFERVSDLLGSSMKSVGEVMAIGRSFEESLQKAIRMVSPAASGFSPLSSLANADLEHELSHPTPDRIYHLARAFREGMSVERIHDLTRIDQWYLSKLHYIVQLERAMQDAGALSEISSSLLRAVKRAGFSDAQIAKLLPSTTEEEEVRARRKQLNIVPVVKQIDTLAAEFPAQTNYLYMTYNGSKSDVPPDHNSVITLGSGVYRIGSSVEFDYCGVMVTRTMAEFGEKTVVINYNPETVSTDYDECDKLYFEELSTERVLDICDHESPKGVIVSVGGQQPQNLAMPLHKAGVPIMGTSPEQIDNAEDRFKFSSLLDRIGVAQPEWKELTDLSEAGAFAEKVGYPVLIRPSYVLSGAAMNVAKDAKELEFYLNMAVDVSPDAPVVITKFVEGAREIEVDAVAQRGKILNFAVAEHIENAGVHSGDAHHMLPSDNISAKMQKTFVDTSEKIAKALEISGPFNVQYLWDRDSNEISVIECNLRASRSLPFSAKVTNVNFLRTVARVFLGHEGLERDPRCGQKLEHVAVKAPQFSFQRLLGADPILGVEMASTGEVACFGDNKYEAFLKALLAVPNNFRMPDKTRNILVSGAVRESFLDSVKQLSKMKYNIHATPEVREQLKAAGIQFSELNHDATDDMLADKKLDLVLNFPDVLNEDDHQYPLRRRTVDLGVPLITNEEVATFLVEALRKNPVLHPKSHRDYFDAKEFARFD